MSYEEASRGDRRGRYESNFSRSRGGQRSERDGGGYVSKRSRDFDDENPRSSRPRFYEDRAPKSRYDGNDERNDRRSGRGGSGPRIRESFDVGFRRGGGNFDRRFDRGGRGGGFGRGSFRGNSRGGDFSRREKSPAEPSRVLGVFGLSPQTEEPDLYEVFSEFGRVDDIQMVFDAVTGRSRGFGFVYFEDLDSAIAARDGLVEGLELHGRVVRIDYSKTVGAHNPTPGLYMGKSKGDDRFESRGGGRRMGSRGGFSSSRGFRGSRGGPRGSRSGHYNGGGNRSRSRSVSLTPPPPVSHGMRSNGTRVSRVRTQSSSRSRSPPPVNVSSRRRQMVEPSSGYRDGYVNGDGGWTDEEK